MKDLLVLLYIWVVIFAGITYHRSKLNDKYQQEAYIKYNIAITQSDRIDDLKEVAFLLEKARLYGKLDKTSLFFLCDCYIELEDFIKAEAIVNEVKRRNMYEHFYIFDIYIQWKLYGTVPKGE